VDGYPSNVCIDLTLPFSLHRSVLGQDVKTMVITAPDIHGHLFSTAMDFCCTGAQDTPEYTLGHDWIHLTKLNSICVSFIVTIDGVPHPAVFDDFAPYTSWPEH